MLQAFLLERSSMRRTLSVEMKKLRLVPKLIKASAVLTAYTVFGIIYISTFLIDPDPEKTRKEFSDPYWKTELLNILKQK